MNDSLKFENLKNILSSLMAVKMHNSSINELMVNYKRDLNEKFTTELETFTRAIDFLEKASHEENELDIQTALLILRGHSMGSAGFYNAIVNDIEILLHNATWEEFPDDYKIPDRYNFDE